MLAARLKPILVLIRPVHWVKNVFVFAPLLLAHHISAVLVAESIKAFVVFCVAASAVYVWNDLMDRTADLAHPTKCLRPIASGAVSTRVAAWLALGLSIVALASAWILGTSFAWVVVAYIVLNLLYTVWLKHVVLIDLFAVAANYLLRIIGGTMIIHETITAWTIILGTLLALFLALGKRRSERVSLEERGQGQAQVHRPTLGAYTPYFLDQLSAVITPTIVMTWILYTLDTSIATRLQTSWMPITIPFVLYGIFRYLYLVHRKKEGESPTHTLLTDIPLIVTLCAWCATILSIRFHFFL